MLNITRDNQSLLIRKKEEWKRESLAGRNFISISNFIPIESRSASYADYGCELQFRRKCLCAPTRAIKRRPVGHAAVDAEERSYEATDDDSDVTVENKAVTRQYGYWYRALARLRARARARVGLGPLSAWCARASQDIPAIFAGSFSKFSDTCA